MSTLLIFLWYAPAILHTSLARILGRPKTSSEVGILRIKHLLKKFDNYPIFAHNFPKTKINYSGESATTAVAQARRRRCG
ncbi:hypothetical protein L1987_70143 [Smallanthus sonchifolius]|uniref:Uncharacterized protein n=1 Tax=Smallanthus sonchifolius TaxID=185202 RepID=A0ACB9ANI0_9ASTR|nr:hypothetical protein L1987_70143 [Smallanthus sonchifolius]